MRHIMTIIALILPLVANSACSTVEDANYQMSTDNPVSRQGTISFILHTDKTYTNGAGQEELLYPVIELKGLANVVFHRNGSAVRLGLAWVEGEQMNTNHAITIQRIELPGPESYFFQYSWDSRKGFFEGYMNGIPLRNRKAVYDPWEIRGQATEVVVHEGPITVTDLKVISIYSPIQEIQKGVPSEYKNDIEDTHYHIGDVSPIYLDSRMGDLIYESNLDNEDSINGWVLEGPGTITFEDDKMIMKSEYEDNPGSGVGHFNLWNPVDIPESFVAEFDFELLNTYGCSVLLFSAKGINEEDLFDPSLAERTGHFMQYIRGDINNYLLTFFYNRKLVNTGRPYINLFKNPGNYEIAHGPVAIKPDSKGFQHLMVIKDRAHIQFLVNGRVFLNFTDPGTDRWGGPALKNGKLAFRHMAGTVAAYKNLKVWELKY